MIKMLPSLNYNPKDPKFNLLDKIFKIIDSKKFKDTCSRKGIKNRRMMVKSIKILFMSMYFNYTVSDVIKELNRSSNWENLQDFLKKYQQQCKSMNTWADILGKNTVK